MATLTSVWSVSQLAGEDSGASDHRPVPPLTSLSFRDCSSFCCCRRMRRILEFQWFLTALSVRPGSIWAILAHLLPISCTSSTSFWSSASVHFSLLTEGLTWLCQLRAHARWRVLGAGHGGRRLP